MAQGSHWIVEDHPRTAVSHYFADAFFHVRAVAVDRAFAACGFLLAVRAASQALCGILPQRGALRAEFPFAAAVVLAAVKAYHKADSALFALNSACHQPNPACADKERESECRSGHSWPIVRSDRATTVHSRA